MPFVSATDAKGKTRADGKRAVTAKKIADGSFFAGLTALEATLDAARQAFANAISQRVQQVASNCELGSEFDATKYPSPSEIMAGWYFETIQPEPLNDGSKLEGMYLPDNVLEAIQDGLERQAAAQVAFGQQQLVEETVKSVQTMAANLAKLAAWFKDQKGRRPAIYDSLVSNVTRNLDKLREFALPETEQGARIIELANAIDQKLDLGGVTADSLKDNASTAERIQTAAQEVVVMAGQMGVEPAPQAKPEPAPQAKPEPEPAPQAKPEPEPEPEPDATDELDTLLDGWD
jgi:cell division septation protein DedD